MDLRLYELLSSEQMRQFNFHSPGLAPLVRWRDRLLAEQEATLHPPPAPVLLEWRYTGKQWGKVAGARRQTGDVIQLTEADAARWASVLEPVSTGVEVGAKA